MSGRIIVVTDPDDIVDQGFRILAVNLNVQQSAAVSTALKNINTHVDVILYMWTPADAVSWMLEKVSKSNLILLNAEDYRRAAISGYLSGFHQTYYFGELQELSAVNRQRLYAAEDCQQTIELHLEKFVTSQRLTVAN